MTTDVVPVLRVSDAAHAIQWYRRLGFELVFEHRFESHLPVYAGIRRDGAQIHLSEHAGDANPHGLVYVWVDDIDHVAAEFAVAVDDQPWGREVNLTDPDGNRLRLASPLAPALDADTVAQLIELERAMWTDATRGDRAWMNDHLTDTFTEFGWSGRRYSRRDILDQEIGPIDAELSDISVRPAGRDAALVTYRSAEPRGEGNRSSLWVRRDGRWLLDFHQGTPST
jgi:uncharacterized glyoxalase superfamily protein PhnB